MAVDIHAPVFEICRRLGVDPMFVGQLVISPTKVEASIFRGSDQGRLFGGRPHVDPESGDVATADLEFEVQT